MARLGEPLLDLGPFSGEATEHRLIPFGKGICGQAAESRETFIVDDVSAASNYLACSLKVQSEIVVPVLDPRSGEVAGRSTSIRIRGPPSGPRTGPFCSDWRSASQSISPA